MARPLEQIRVIDLTTTMAGPFGSMVLGDLGAEVIKIEPIDGGDASREIPPYFHDGESMYYISLNRNKRSVTLNLDTDKGKEIFYALVKKSDVVIANFRPGIMTKLKIDYKRLKVINPRIICCSMTAFGEDGPYGRQPAYDLTIQALAGAMSMTGEEGRAPLRLGIPMGDLAASIWAVVGILSALYYRQQTGEGQLVDLSLLDSLVSFITYPALYYSYGGEVAKPLGSGHQSVVPFQAFKTKDHYITVVCGKVKFWQGLCEAAGIQELASDPRFKGMDSRGKHKDELIPILDKIFLQKTTAEWEELLVKAGVPCAPVHTIDQVFTDPAIQNRGMVISMEHFGKTLRLFGSPLKMSASPITEYRTPPKLGADTRQIFTELLGYSQKDIDKLKANKII